MTTRGSSHACELGISGRGTQLSQATSTGPAYLPEPGEGDFSTGHTAQGPVTKGKGESIYLVGN